jgi:hypothetical protein
LPEASTLIVAIAWTVPISSTLPIPKGCVVDCAIDSSAPELSVFVIAVADVDSSEGWLVTAIPAVALDDRLLLSAFSVYGP